MNTICQSLKKKVAKIKLVFFILFIALFFLTGCWDRIELNNIAIVTATAIDQADDGQVEVALEIYIPKVGGGSSQGGVGGSGNGELTMVVYRQGTNLADALSKIQADLPREIFWGSCKVFIFGEEAAKNGVKNHMDFLLRSKQPRENAFAFVSEGKARKMLEQKATLESFSAEGIRKVVDQEKVIKITLKDLDEMLMDKAQSLALPYIHLKEIKSDDGKVLRVTRFIGTAMFKEDRMVGIFSEATTEGLLWLRNELKNYTFSIKPEHEKGEISLFPVFTKVKLIPKVTGDEWKIVVNVMTKGTIVQNGTTLGVDDSRSLEIIKKAYAKQIEDRLKETIEDSQKLKVDALHFGTVFHRKYPKEWKKIKKRWEDFFPEVKVEFIIDATIRRKGYIDKSMKLEER